MPVSPDAVSSRALDRFTPRAGVRTQLFAAAFVWAVGAGILLVRGVIYVHDRSWHAWVLGASLAVLIAVPKTRYVLDRVAANAIARIHKRGRACVFGFFSWRSWLFVGVMMGGGIAIRNTFVRPGVVGAGILGALYVGIGAALLVADRAFWRAALLAMSASRSEEAEES